MDYTEEETQFIKFLESYPQFYKKAHKIAENKTGKSILATGRGRNEFEMYSLDDICRSCGFFDGNIPFTPKTTDAIWYKKTDDIFNIYLIEFKGDCLFQNSRKCKIYEVYESLQYLNEKYKSEERFKTALKDLDDVIAKFSDKLLNSLISKPLETVTIALPLIYENYYEKNKDMNGVKHIDIKKFLASSRIIYRVVSISEDVNRQKARANAFRCSNESPILCEMYAEKYEDKSIKSSYQSSLQTHHLRYEKAGIVYSAGFIDNHSFNNFVNKRLK